ncbi:MAG: tetratricopeptide repeat protein [Terriglobales bacterium]
MKRILPTFAVFLAVCAAWGQSRTSAPSGAQTIVVMPFENESKAPGLEWIGESFPEVLGQRLSSLALYVVPREDREYALDRAGIPANVHLSRATLFHIAEQMDADYAVLGSFNYDGQTFSAVAQILDLKRLRLSPELKEQGELVKMMTVENALAWDVLHQVRPELAGAKDPFVAAAPPVRLDAFESYIRGEVSTSHPAQIKYFREALKLNPDYVLAMLALGRTYYDGRDYEQAIPWLAKVPHDDDRAREANFYLGLAAFYQGDYDNAATAFNFLATRMPLTEVYNNLGVVAARKGKRSALDYFRKSVDADPSDPDYRFNYAVSLYKAGDSAGAARQLREALKLRPADAETRSFLESIAANGAARLQPTQQAENGPHVPLERIKQNYDESSLQQLALEIENAAEARLANTDPASHAQYHVQRGQELLEQGFRPEAERNFQEAVRLDPTNAAAHVGLARILEMNSDWEGARREADAAVHFQATADAYMVLARVSLQQNQIPDAEHNLQLALTLDPKNAAALELQKTLAEKQK